MRKDYVFVRADSGETVTVRAAGKKHAAAKALVELFHPGEDPAAAQRVIAPVLPVPANILVLLVNEGRREARTDKELGTPSIPVLFYS